MPLGAQTLAEFVDLVRILRVDGVDLEAVGAGRCDDEVARVVVAQPAVFFDGGALSAAEPVRTTVSVYFLRDVRGERQIRYPDRLGQCAGSGRHGSPALSDFNP
jgi:hypothetical protein